MNVEAEVTSLLVGQTIKFTFEGASIILKIFGKGAKEMAILIAALLKDEKKWAGATSLKRMLREGRPMRVIQIPQDRFKEFAQAAKHYGVLFNALQQKNKTNGICDIFIRSEDAALVNRVLERTKISCVEIASIDPKVTYRGQTINPTTPEAGDRSAPASGKSMNTSNPATVRPSLSAAELRQAMENPAYLFEDALRYKSYLEMRGRVYDYSPKNLELIAGQRPDAQMVASRSKWREMGRTVNEDAEPIIINVPGEIVNGVQTFTDGKVYDISDTEGAPVPLPAVPEEGSEELSSLVAKMRSACPVEVRVDPAAQEWAYSPELKAVVLPEGLSDTDTFHALACETVQAHMHQILGDRYAHESVDLLAESTACTVAAHAHLSTDPYTFPEVPNLLAQGQNEKSLNGMLRGSAQLADALNKHLAGPGTGGLTLPRVAVNLNHVAPTVQQSSVSPSAPQVGGSADAPIEYPPSVSETLKGLSGQHEPAHVERPTLSANELRQVTQQPAFMFEDGQRLKSYLEMKGRLYNYSEKNVKLIASQRPDAQMVASRSRWRQMGRSVNEDAQPITITVPGEVVNGRPTFADGQIFDISDTHGAPLPLPTVPVEGSQELANLVGVLEESIPSGMVGIRYDPAAEQAAYVPEDHEIVLPEGLTDTETFYALAREGYHAHMHLFGGDEYHRADFELLANCNACIIAAHCNMPTDRFDFSGVTEFAQGKDVKELSATLDGAAGHAASINQKIDFHIANHGSPAVGMSQLTNDMKAR